jgi:hypothetical protein
LEPIGLIVILPLIKSIAVFGYTKSYTSIFRQLDNHSFLLSIDSAKKPKVRSARTLQNSRVHNERVIQGLQANQMIM